MFVLAMFPVSCASLLAVIDRDALSRSTGWMPPLCLVIQCVRVGRKPGRGQGLNRQQPLSQLPSRVSKLHAKVSPLDGHTVASAVVDSQKVWWGRVGFVGCRGGNMGQVMIDK